VLLFFPFFSHPLCSSQTRGLIGCLSLRGCPTPFKETRVPTTPSDYIFPNCAACAFFIILFSIGFFLSFFIGRSLFPSPGIFPLLLQPYIGSMFYRFCSLRIVPIFDLFDPSLFNFFILGPALHLKPISPPSQFSFASCMRFGVTRDPVLYLIDPSTDFLVHFFFLTFLFFLFISFILTCLPQLFIQVPETSSPVCLFSSTGVLIKNLFFPSGFFFPHIPLLKAPSQTRYGGVDQRSFKRLAPFPLRLFPSSFPPPPPTVSFSTVPSFLRSLTEYFPPAPFVPPNQLPSPFFCAQ